MVEHYDLDEVPSVPKQFDQLGILVLDGSGSMSEVTKDKITKAEAVSSSVKELIGRLKSSRQASNFSIAVITFDTVAKLHTAVTPVEDADDYGDYNPYTGHGGGTSIGVGLQSAGDIAKKFLSELDTVPRTVVIIVMSDGESSDDPRLIAEELKNNPGVTICTTFFAAASTSTDEKQTSSAQDLLREIASSPLHYRTTYKSDDLRKFFLASMSSGRNVAIF